MELAYQLKIDMRKRMEEIKELDSEVKHKVGQLVHNYNKLYLYLYICIIRSKSVISLRSNWLRLFRKMKN